MTYPHFLKPTRSSFTNLIFLFIVLFTGWYPVAWILQHHWSTGWYPSPEVTLILTFLGIGPGLAAWLATAFGQLSFQKTLGLTVGKPLLLFPAWFLLPILAMLAAAISVLLGLAEWDWHMINSLQTAKDQWPDHAHFALFYPKNSIALWGALLLFGPLVWLLPAWLEETAWRGFFYSRLIKYGFWITALLTGLLTWFWKLPFYWLGIGYPEHPKLGLGLSLIFCLLISILFTWLRRASGSTLAPSIARATLASSAIFPLSITQLYDPVYTHLQGLTGLTLLAIFIGCAWMLGLFRSTT